MTSLYEQAEAIEAAEPKMLRCTICQKDIGTVTAEVYEANFQAVRCANCQLDGQAEPRWMNAREEEPDEEAPGEDCRPQCGCGSRDFEHVSTSTLFASSEGYDYDDSLLYFSGVPDEDYGVQCSSCGRDARHFEWDVN